MTDKDKSNSRGERPNHGFNFVLYAIVIAIAITMGMVYLYQSSSDKLAYSDLRVALSDRDGDGSHELWLHRNDHGIHARFLLLAE